MTGLRLTASLCIFFVLGIIAADFFQIRTPLISTEKRALRQQFQPCLTNITKGNFVSVMNDLNKNRAFVKEGEYIFEPVIPEGLYKDDFVPQYCFAVQKFSGDVVLYERPFTSPGFDMSIPFWIPNSYRVKRGLNAPDS
jgi:hypothetical protein